MSSNKNLLLSLFKQKFEFYLNFLLYNWYWILFYWILLKIIRNILLNTFQKYTVTSLFVNIKKYILKIMHHGRKLCLNVYKIISQSIFESKIEKFINKLPNNNNNNNNNNNKQCPILLINMTYKYEYDK